MSRIGIGYVEVAAAASKIHSQNANPTVDRVRELLGTGSRSTIARHLKEWKIDHETTANTDALPDQLTSLVTNLWEHLQAGADQRIQEFGHIANQKISEAEHSKTQAHSQAAELSTHILQLEAALDSERSTTQTLQANLAQERSEAAKFRERIRNLEIHSTEQQQENDKLHLLLTQVQGNLQKYQDSMQKQQEQQQEQALLAEQQALKAQADSDNYKAQIAELQRQGIDLERTLNQQQQQLQFAQAQYSAVYKQNEVAKQSLDAKLMQLIKEEQKSAIALSRVKDLEQALGGSNQQLANLGREQITILQEKAHLEGQLKHLLDVHHNAN